MYFTEKCLLEEHNYLLFQLPDNMGLFRHITTCQTVQVCHAYNPLKHVTVSGSKVQSHVTITKSRIQQIGPQCQNKNIIDKRLILIRVGFPDDLADERQSCIYIQH